MRHIFSIFIFLLVLQMPVAIASPAIFNLTAKDSLPLVGDTLIGFATSDFYPQVPEGNLGNLVADAVKFYATKTLNEKINIVLIASQSIKGNIKKGEIYERNIRGILPTDDSIFVYKFPKKDLQPLMDKVAMLGGMPCAGVSFKILNMRAVDILLVNDTGSVSLPYFTLATTKYTIQRMKMKMPEDNLPLNATLRRAVMSYIQDETAKGKAIFGYIEKRISYKN